MLLRSCRLACSNKEGRPDLSKTIPDVSSTNSEVFALYLRAFFLHYVLTEVLKIFSTSPSKIHFFPSILSL